MENVGTQVEGASGSGSFFTTLLISMAGIVFTTLAIVAYHFLVVKYCLRRRQRQMQLQFQASLAQQPATRQSIGVDEKVLNTIPILIYSTKDVEIFRMDQSECVICLGHLEEGNLVRLLPSCKHVFHNPCIEMWFMGHSNCPVCRSAIDVPIASISSMLPVEHDHDHDDQVRDCELEEAGPVSCSLHPHDPEESLPISTAAEAATTTTTTTQLSKPNDLLRHCVSLVVLPMEDSSKQQILLKGLERSLSLDHSHVLINIYTESDDKPSSSSSSSSSSYDCASLKPVLTHCGSLKVRSMRQLDRMSSVLVKSISQLRMSQGFSTANGNGNLPC